jgi:hypothetical protein
MWRLMKRWRLELCWLALLVLFTLLAPKRVVADFGRLLFEAETCADEPWDCWIEI